uniref:Candidate secreted effector n=1 Tax=Meloidogyne incognita TaxID=6306 RepID=A0A914MJW3_MELIC
MALIKCFQIIYRICSINCPLSNNYPRSINFSLQREIETIITQDLNATPENSNGNNSEPIRRSRSRSHSRHSKSNSNSRNN